MRTELTMLGLLAGYIVWSSSLAGIAGQLLSAISR